MTTPPPTTGLTGHARAIVKALLLGGQQSRAALSEEVDLSAGSLTRLTKPLIAAGLILEQPPSDPQPGLGRPSVPLVFNHAAFRFVGIKLTKPTPLALLPRPMRSLSTSTNCRSRTSHRAPR